MAKGSSGGYRSVVSGRYIPVKGQATAGTLTKEGVARVEASWKRASEATGAFQSKGNPNPSPKTR